MKTTIAILLIIMGSILIMVPAVFDIIHDFHVVAHLGSDGAAKVNLPNNLEGLNRLGYWITGSLMALVGVIASFRPAARQTTLTAK